MKEVDRLIIFAQTLFRKCVYYIETQITYEGIAHVIAFFKLTCIMNGFTIFSTSEIGDVFQATFLIGAKAK